MKFNLLVI